jgi:predicted permease
MSEPVWRRIARLYGPDPRADVREEFEHHLEERVEALMAKGMTEAAAREQALRQFGDIDAAAALCSDIGMQRVRRARWTDRLGSIAMDVGYALKAMRRLPGFTAATVLTIALGVGANTAVFSLLYALLLQPLDAARPGELVRVYTSEGRAPRNERDLLGGSSYADYVDLQRSPALAGLVAFMPIAANVRLNDAHVRVEGRVVSENFFSVLGRPLYRGQFDAATPNDVVISYNFWNTKLSADPNAVGSLIDVNGRRLRIAGITAADFKGIEPSDIAIYFPLRTAPDLTGRVDILTERGERSIKLLGRVAEGTSPQAAEQSLDAIMKALSEQFPASNARRTITVREARSIVPLELLGGAVIPTAGLVFGATVVMLAIAGVNVAAVLLARTIRRRRELAIRLSIGATRLRVVRQLVTESVTLALVAGAVVLVVIALLPLLVRSLGAPAAVQPTIDAAVLGYALAVVIGFGMLCGIVPAVGGMRSDVIESLRGGGVSDRPTKARAQRALVCAQIALSMLLLLVSGGLLGSLNRQLRVDPGFEPVNLIVANFEDPAGTPNRERERVFNQLMVERLSALPGVASLSMTNMTPLTSEGARGSIHIPGYTEQVNENMEVPFVIASPDFFKTLGIPMLRGRELAWSDRDTVTRVVVNRSMARKYWGDRNPVGSFVHIGGKSAPPAEVIGVVGDARFRSLSEAPLPTYFIQQAGVAGASVLIRTRGDADALLLSLRATMSRNDVPLLLTRLQTMENIVQSSLVVTRTVSRALLTTGILALLLAAVGLYGVVSCVMSGRTREFGVRLALGATPSSITRMVLGYGMRMTLIGGIIGLVLGFSAIRLIGSMIFGSASYVTSGLAFALVLGAVTLVACAVPAMRATAVGPASALRPE